MQFKYQVYRIPKDYDVEKCLNDMGLAGWRVIQYLPQHPHFSNNVQPAFLLERETIGG